MQNAREDRTRTRLLIWTIVVAMVAQALEAAQAAVALAGGIG